MKKISTLLLSAGVLAMTGCTSSEILEEGAPELRGAISFGTTNVSKPSRADNSINNSLFTDFYVFGTYQPTTSSQPVTVFNNEQVHKAENKWTYDGSSRYWVPGKSYDFYAYSCGNSGYNVNNATNYVTPNLSVRVLNLANVIADQTHQHDLLFAKKTNQVRGTEEGGTTGTVSPVDLQFKHIFTRLKFTFTSELPDAKYKMTISNVRVSGMYNTGFFQGSDESWASTGVNAPTKVPTNASNVPYIDLAVGDGVVTSAGIACDPIFVIPYVYSAADVALDFDMDITYNGEEVLGRHIRATWTPNWIKGQSLNNKINIDLKDATGLQPIEFKASIVGDTGADTEGWVNGTGGIGSITFEPTVTTPGD